MDDRLRRLRNIALAGLGAAGVLLPLGAAATPADPSGTWLTKDERARVRVEHCASKPERICGYVVWMKEPHDDKGQLRRDESNPDPAKRSRALLGHQMILGLKPNEDDHFEGKIYDAENGKSYDITLWRESADEMKVHGCMLAVLCGSQSWTKTTDLAPNQLTGPTGGPNGPKADPEYSAAAKK